MIEAIEDMEEMIRELLLIKLRHPITGGLRSSQATMWRGKVDYMLMSLSNTLEDAIKAELTQRFQEGEGKDVIDIG